MPGTGAMLPARLKGMTSGQLRQASWEFEHARKDTGSLYRQHSRKEYHWQLYRHCHRDGRWIKKGHGNDDWTVIGSAAV